jgi:hypothetical protein
MRFAWTEHNLVEHEALQSRMIQNIRSFIHCGDPSKITGDEAAWRPWNEGQQTRICGGN